MKNWPRNNRSLLRKSRLCCTDVLIGLSLKLKKKGIPVLRSLENYAEFSRRILEYEHVECPSNLEIDLECLSFSDVFLPEDFYLLETGLIDLIASNDSCQLRRQDIEMLKNWFKTLRQSRVNNNSYVGTYNLPIRKNIDSRISTQIKSISFRLKYVYSSFVVVSIIVYPSIKFVDKFRKLIRSKVSPENEIIRFSLRHLEITSSSRTSGIKVRQLEVEEMLLEVNRCIVLLLRKYVKCGFSKLGPLPCIEVFSINIPLAEIPDSDVHVSSFPMLQGCMNFMNTLGYPMQKQLIYSNDKKWWQLYQYEYSGESASDILNYRVLASSVDFETHENPSIVRFCKKPSIALEKELYSLAELLSINYSYQVFSRLILSCRDDLKEVLSYKPSLIKKHSLAAAMKVMRSLNKLYFEVSILSDQLEQTHLISQSAFSLKRPTYEEPGFELFVNDMNYRINETRAVCMSQLRVLKNSYKQFLEIKVILLDFKQQKITVILSILIGLITILTIVPETLRNQIWTITVEKIDIWRFLRL